MKNPFLSILLLAGIAMFTLSCGQTQKAQQSTSAAASDLAPWNTHVDAYHEVMSTTFHPAEDGNLQPLKTKAGILAERGAAWANMTLPPSLQGKGIEAKLQALATGSREIAELVQKNASDEALTKAITALHDVFHEVVEMGGGH